MKNYALALFVIGMMAVGCQKESNDDDGTSNGKMELITSSSWKFDQANVDTDDDGDGDFPAPIDACVTDNILTFKSDSTGTVAEGATKCDPSDPNSTAFTWSFKSDQTILSTPGEIVPGVSGDIKITVLTSSKLQLQKVVNLPVLGNKNVIVDLKH
jgi:lipocalin-like protein